MKSALKITLVVHAAALLCGLAATLGGPAGLTAAAAATPRPSHELACAVREDIATPLVHVARRSLERQPFAC